MVMVEISFGRRVDGGMVMAQNVCVVRGSGVAVGGPGDVDGASCGAGVTSGITRRWTGRPRGAR
ncbi:hypothetical protein ADL03_15765 [Nocardia sp. NRRL S-836]|nr:hypothetical protein ADL03_15765 [Nocardia sp. NRRL S-836]